MIKLIREANRRYPWLLVTIMGVIVVTFIVGMGWWGFGQAQGNRVASISGSTISLDEYKRTYRNVENFYRENKREIKPEELEKVVLDDLITTKIWTVFAKDMGLSVGPSELRADVIKTQGFQKDGRFDPDLYRRVLAMNRLTPALYETIRREQLLAQKAMKLVVESVALTPSELAEAKALVASQFSNTPDSPQLSQDLILNSFLNQKQQRALLAYAESLKSIFPVEIHRENL